LFVAGCGKSQPAPAPQAESASEISPAAAAAPNAALDVKLHQPFAEAVTADPPAEQRPPDKTLTGKSVGKLYTDVVQSWDSIKFAAPNGNRIGYRASLETDLGAIEIMLRPEIAPNHVRSFIALARAGYYDGLLFHRTITESLAAGAEGKLEIIEAGCPLGNGGPGYGSIGYWLKPEFSSTVSHDEGTVGACHGEAADSAACKFYINLAKAPFLDGNYTVFGQITSGLDVARKILTLPVRNDPEFPEGDRPVNPVVIRKVTIHVDESPAK
jgi:peptidyl-prolyl cis-trans isomerase B (cyclophilin B)